MKYQIVIPSGSSGTAGSSATTAKGKKVGALADAVHMLSSGAMNMAVGMRAQRAIKNIEPTIQKRMPAKGGVLLEIIIEEGPKGVEFPTKWFKGVYLAGSGLDPQATVRRRRATPRMYSANKDYIARSSWLWVTQ